MGALFNLTDFPAVTGVVAGGPAAAAGLRAGDQLVAMNGVSLAALPTRRTRRANGSRFTAIANRLADAFARGPVTLTLRRDGVTTVRRITGTSGLWVTEYILTYDGRPSYTVSIMEFRDGKVARETQYFGDPFEPGPSRAQWVEQM